MRASRNFRAAGVDARRDVAPGALLERRSAREVRNSADLFISAAMRAWPVPPGGGRRRGVVALGAHGGQGRPAQVRPAVRSARLSPARRRRGSLLVITAAGAEVIGMRRGSAPGIGGQPDVPACWSSRAGAGDHATGRHLGAEEAAGRGPKAPGRAAENGACRPTRHVGAPRKSRGATNCRRMADHDASAAPRAQKTIAQVGVEATGMAAHAIAASCAGAQKEEMIGFICLAFAREGWGGGRRSAAGDTRSDGGPSGRQRRSVEAGSSGRARPEGVVRDGLG